jgi:RecB family exonuclease
MSFSEPSRFITQLREIGGVEAQDQSVSLQARQPNAIAIKIEKSDHIKELLGHYTTSTKALFPTNIVNYLKCSLQFYLIDILQLKKERDVTEEMESIQFGNILHNSMEALYKPYYDRKELITESSIRKMMGYAAETVRNQLMREYHFTNEAQIAELGYVAATEDVLVTIVNKLLKRDLARVPFTVIKLESKLSTNFLFPISLDGRVEKVRLNGKFDRVDLMEDGSVEIVDFKTGSRVETHFKAWNDLFTYQKSKDFKEAFQILSYAWLLHKVEGYSIVKPTVLRIGDLFSHNSQLPESELFYLGGEAITNIVPFVSEIGIRLEAVLKEIFDLNTPFTQTEAHNVCKFCSFVGLCHRDQLT